MFFALYLSEGAPIGFIWLGLPTRLRAMEVPLERITWLLALLILPWTFKFLWAPLVDLLRGPTWSFRHWILAAQTTMVAALTPLLWLDLKQQFFWTSVTLTVHALAAATQDVAIDALCIHHSDESERAQLNGWMQCGMLAGRALMGGGSLILESWLGYQGVVLVLIGLVGFSALFVWSATESISANWSSAPPTLAARAQQTLSELWGAVLSRAVWIGLGFAALAPAAFKSLEAVIGPFLIDRSYSQLEIGQFTTTAMIAFMILGSLSAGHLGQRIPAKRLVTLALFANVMAIGTLALADLLAGQTRGFHLLVLLSLVALTIGLFTVSLYSWLMNLTRPGLAASQFTTFMAATNACEAWSTWFFGQLQRNYGYSGSMFILCATSVSAALLLAAREK